MKKLRSGPSTDTQMIFRQPALGLLILTSLFAFRVIAQLIQYWYPVEFLPAFDRWHSGRLPYGWLLGAQVLILAMCMRIVWRLFHNKVIPARIKGRVLVVGGLIYFGGMCIRLLLGSTVASEHDWFGALLPTVFHLVLASFVILYGRFHFFGSQASSAFPKGESI